MLLVDIAYLDIVIRDRYGMSAFRKQFLLCYPNMIKRTVMQLVWIDTRLRMQWKKVLH